MKRKAFLPMWDKGIQAKDKARQSSQKCQKPKARILKHLQSIIPKKKKSYKELEFIKLEFLTRYSSSPSSSTLEINKKTAFYYKMVLELGVLEYCIAWYSSLPCSSTT